LLLGQVLLGFKKHGEGLQMSSNKNDIAIKLDSVSKCFQIYEKPHHRLLQSFFRGKRQYFKEFWALKDISFEIKRGETVGIIGRNGAGKSTLLQIICGTLAETSGSVEVNGRVAALLELGAGFNPEFTGRENVYMSGSILGLSQEEIDKKYDEIVRFADIGEFIEQPVKTYSSGMYVRLAFAVIAHVDADILVIDEALAVGDAFFTQKCMRFLRKFKENGTLLFVSHDTASVVNFCDKAIWLDVGVTKLIGTAKKVTECYLKGLYEAKQGDSVNLASSQTIKPDDSELEFGDQRLSIINNNPYRNDLEIFKFNENTESFGNNEVKIVDVWIYDKNGKPLSWVVGGESVTLAIKCHANSDVEKIIVGFFIKDRLGQTLFGDNTYLTYIDQPISIKANNYLIAKFSFNMPIFPVGNYSICAAVAEGNQNEHIQHHWLHDAIIFESHSSSVSTGLIGVPMKEISIDL
jgi:lipopolysaccharide transport system ATP-binding protein